MKSIPERALVVTDRPVFNGTDVQQILISLDLSLDAVSVITASGSLSKSALAQGVFNTGAASLNKNLLLAGFTDIADSEATLSGQGELCACTARKPDWETGASTALPRSSKLRAAAAPAPAPAAQQPPKRAVWSLAADEEEEELLDDDELLTEEDLKRPEVPAVGDCEAGASKKACADCSCGRAEAEAAGIKAELTADMLKNPQSACGSCGMGDAFRCASCPYRGLPKFEMGQKIELPSDFLTADA
ncbi:DUF689-domain-containing protein [Coccomyxa subellipsoidea C-169]|uniref:Anamorsin homolog n=1 Tax=Coccomyxa subellipsoidea (strain C-169) TaxID=574566 RepID=I0YJK0_COCSC|nr:DUF689-domain-containing protein [Coccomyxa subellipsoidea C-169]EIE18569.1 DUF689-domain-containing protein [Coccomyxa subellipsoidea C-169]|eukprot:XP_005643113.1 DUF689-domain-containing protein [Coccomyxa subellipsoidea C-169]